MSTWKCDRCGSRNSDLRPGQCWRCYWSEPIGTNPPGSKGKREKRRGR